jgi:signal transduction histidine kinase
MFSGLVFRMTAPLLAVSLLLLILGAFTAWWVHTMQQEAMDLNSQSIATSNASHTIENQLLELQTDLNKFEVNRDSEALEKAQQASQNVKEALAKSEQLDSMDDGNSLLPQIREQYARFDEVFREINAPTNAETNLPELLNRVQAIITQELIPTAKKQSRDQQRRLVGRSHESQEVADRVSLTLLLLVTCGAIGGLTAGVAVARSVNRSIVELNIPVHAATGALNEVVGPLKFSSNGNLTAIREALDEMANRVGETVQRLQVSQQRVLRSEQMTAIGQLAAGLAHEIRNPLTAMRSLVQMARQSGGASALDDQDVEILGVEIERLNELVQTFLDFARPPKLSWKKVDLAAVIQRTVQLTQSRIDRQGISLKLDLPDSAVELSADPQQLQQVMLNLVINAVESQPTGGQIEIRLRELRSLEMLREVEIQVTDRGTGIATEIIDRIFDPFFSTKEAGTGLGLAICQRIIEDHGGTIVPQSHPQGGAVFTIRLPSFHQDTQATKS